MKILEVALSCVVIFLGSFCGIAIIGLLFKKHIINFIKEILEVIRN